MSFVEIQNRAIRLFRERIFVNHKTPEIRELISELTMINESDDEIYDLFLIRNEFMVGLKIFDSIDNELVVLPNEYTKKLFGKFVNKDSRGPNIYNELLEKMKKHEVFVLWIKFPPNTGLKPFNPTVIKLTYRDNSSPLRIPFEDSFHNTKFLFSIPRFSVENIKQEGLLHDIFYIIQAPENCELEHNIPTNVKISNNQKIELSKKDGIYDDHNNERFISVRVPPIKERTEFEMFYDVILKKSERSFNATLLSTLIGISLFVTLISVGIFDSNKIIFFKPIFDHANTIFGGIVTASLAVIGIFRTSIYNRLRYWLTIPIIIAAIGFMFNIKIP